MKQSPLSVQSTTRSQPVCVKGLPLWSVCLVSIEKVNIYITGGLHNHSTNYLIMTLAGAQNVLRYLLTNTEVFFFSRGRHFEFEAQIFLLQVNNVFGRRSDYKICASKLNLDLS